MENIKNVALGRSVVTVAIMLSCSGQPEKKLGYLGGPGGNDGNVAHAAPAGGSGGALQTAMPENPSHISFRITQMPEVLVQFLSVNSYPYEITEEGDKTVMTIFIPQGVTISVTFSPMDEDGKPVSKPVTFTIEPEAKLGTYDIEIGEASKDLKFSAGAQKTLQVGENILDVPSSDQFIGGATSPVVQGVYRAEYDQVCHLSWIGAEELRIFRNGPAECHTGPVSLSLKEGEEVGVYPVTPGSQLDSEPVHILIETKEE